MNVFEIIYYSLCKIFKSYQSKREYADNAFLLIVLMQINNVATIIIPVKVLIRPSQLITNKEQAIVYGIVLFITIYLVNHFYLVKRKEIIDNKYASLSASKTRVWKILSIVYAIASPILLYIMGTYVDN